MIARRASVTSKETLNPSSRAWITMREIANRESDPWYSNEYLNLSIKENPVNHTTNAIAVDTYPRKIPVLRIGARMK